MSQRNIRKIFMWMNPNEKTNLMETNMVFDYSYYGYPSNISNAIFVSSQAAVKYKTKKV